MGWKEAAEAARAMKAAVRIIVELLFVFGSTIFVL